MNKSLTAEIDSSYGRKTLSFYINPAAENKAPDKFRDYSTLDLFPTTIAALGADIEGDKLGLGVNLFSGKETLLEELGKSELRDKLLQKSDFLIQSGNVEINDDYKEFLKDIIDLTRIGGKHNEYTATNDCYIDVFLDFKPDSKIYDFQEFALECYSKDKLIYKSEFKKIKNINNNYRYRAPLSINDYYLNNGDDITLKVMIKADNKKTYLYETDIVSPDLFVCDNKTYLDSINNERYAVFMSAKDDGAAGMSKTVQKGLESMGVFVDMDNSFRKGYYGVIDNGNTVYDVAGNVEDAVSTNGTISGTDISYSVYSSGFESDNKSSIIIDGTEYSTDHRGLNIVIYDKKKKKVVDTSYIDNYNKCARKRVLEK